jgi:phage gp29-like protein
VDYQKFKLATTTATPAAPNPTSTVVPIQVASSSAKKSSLRQEMYAVQVRRLRQDVGKWRAALERAENVFYPERVQLLNIYSDLVLDLHLSSVISTRKISVTSRPFRLVDAEGKENVAITKLLKKPWFRQFMNHALDSIFWGYSLLEFPVPQNGEFKSVDLIDRQYLFPEAGLVRSMPGMITGVSYLEDPRYAPWVIPVGDPRDLGLLNKCAPVGLFKKNILAAWADFTEVFGMPFRSVSTDAEGDELDKIEDMLANMGQSSYGVFPEDTKVEYIQAATANEQLYNAAIERFNSELSKGILGQTMTTDSGSSLSQSEVHERVAASYTRDDCEWMAELVNFTLLPLSVVIVCPRIPFESSELNRSMAAL